ncbi:MAG: DUF4160 domain-containing protein [Eubacterium sp.]|nr:DUF4160 domain-containing protein [Eubacterium sp.]
MPIISRFDGLTIKMYFSQSEHDPPHIHVQYAEHAAVVEIKTGNILDGSLPKKQAKRIKEWTNNNKDELLEMWETKEIHKL